MADRTIAAGGVALLAGVWLAVLVVGDGAAFGVAAAAMAAAAALLARTRRARA